VGKTGWQATTYILAGLCAMLGAAAWNNARTVDATTASLRNVSSRTPAVDPDCGGVQVIYEREPPAEPYVMPSPAPRGGRCINGQRFDKRGNEWVQLGPC
jgi:hypothetical protein